VATRAGSMLMSCSHTQQVTLLSQVNLQQQISTIRVCYAIATCLRTNCDNLFFLHVRQIWTPISIKIRKIVLEQTRDETMPKMPTSPKYVLALP